MTLADLARLLTDASESIRWRLIGQHAAPACGRMARRHGATRDRCGASGFLSTPPRRVRTRWSTRRPPSVDEACSSLHTSWMSREHDRTTAGSCRDRDCLPHEGTGA